MYYEQISEDERLLIEGQNLRTLRLLIKRLSDITSGSTYLREIMVEELRFRRLLPKEN